MSRQRFAARNGGDTVRLVERNPLAWIFLTDEDGPFATAVPIRPSLEDDDLRTLIGHVPRRTRIARAFEDGPRALILILGPHGYVSPSWMSDRTQAPTWNFASAQFVADIELVDDENYLEGHLRDLTGALESDRDGAWQVDEMGQRYEKLAARIVAFEARIVSRDARFKLGQDESDRTFREILDALESQGDAALAELMREFNDERSGEE